jgi:EAL domain-containing protein (putative c-di-GMP-specific phosphodiesterase class I)
VITTASTCDNLLIAADDERDFLDLVTQLAEAVGFRVLKAENAATLKDLLTQHSPTLVLLDLQLPGMDGVEALRYLARNSIVGGVALVSAMDQRVLSSARQLGESLGLKMIGTLQKPAMLEDIETLLIRHRGPVMDLKSADLRNAVEEMELAVHYHPKLGRVDSQWQVCGAEALLRWQHPERGLLYPKDFLQLADDHQLIIAIADFVITDAIRQVGHWRSHGVDLSVAVNLSPRLLKDLEFPDRLSRILTEFSVAPSQLNLEVIEDASHQSGDLAMDIYTRLRVKGIGLALDDFGTGISSLTHLAKMPFSEVKIDRSVISNVPHNRSAVTFVKAIIQMAHALSLKVCAEGVETASAFDFLDDLGCDHMQGDFISKPIAASEFESFIAAWSDGRQLVRSA